MSAGTVNACEGYKMAISKFLPSLVHFVRGFAAWAFFLTTSQTYGTGDTPMSHLPQGDGTFVLPYSPTSPRREELITPRAVGFYIMMPCRTFVIILQGNLFKCLFAFIVS